MLDIKAIKESKEELESGNTTFDACIKLAAIYTILDRIDEDKAESKVISELSDILPAYQKYAYVKREYQEGNAGKEAVVKSLELVCREIYDLIKTLYSCSDMPLERVKIQNMIEAIYSELIPR